MALPSADDEVWRDAGLACVLVQERVELHGAQHVAKQLLEEQYQDHLCSLCLDLVPLLATSTASTPEVLHLFQHMARVCSAKEMNLALLEALDTEESLPVALKLLHPLKNVLERLLATSKLRVVGATARDVLHRLQHLRQCQKQLLSQSELERSGEGTDCHEEDGERSADKLCTVTDMDYVMDLLGFWKAVSGIFLHGWTKAGSRVNNELSSVQNTCISGLLSLLGDPIAAADLSHNGEELSSVSHNSSGELAPQIVELLSLLKCGIHILVGEGPPSSCTTELPTLDPQNEGVACLCYLWMVEGVCWSMRPTPLRDEYLAVLSFRQAAALLNRSADSCVKKGLALVERCSEIVPCGSLDRCDLTGSSCMDLLQALITVAVYCDDKTLRSQSVTAFRNVVKLFHDEARHRMYRVLFHQITHPGLWGLLVHDLKNEVDRAIKGNSPASPFLGDRLLPLLYTVCRLPTFEEEMAVLKESDRLMAVVNFLRFLLLADTPVLNKTNVWHDVGYWRDTFCQPLLNVVEDSKDHHKRLLVGAKGREGGGGGTQERVSLPEVSVTVGGKVLSTEEDEWGDKQALAASLLQLEMLQDTTQRLIEIMNEQSQISPTPDVS